MTPGRILALDLGKRRIGLALSDELGLTAQGLETLQRTNIREDLASPGETGRRPQRHTDTDGESVTYERA